MASIGNLAVFLSANSAELESGLQKATDQVNNFSRTLTVGLQAATAGFAAGFGKSLIENALAVTEAINQTAKDAAKVGLSVMDMAAVQKFAGSQSEEFTRALGHLNVILGQVQAGSEQASKQLAAVGIDAAKLLALPEYERIRSLLDFFKGLSSETEKAAAAQAIFSRTGIDMVGVLSKGAAALDEVSERTRRYYKDVYSAENVEQVKALVKEQKEMQELWSGTMARAGVALVQSLTDDAKELREVWQSIIDLDWGDLWDSRSRKARRALASVATATGVVPTADITAPVPPPLRDRQYEGIGGYFGQVTEERLTSIFQKTRTPLEQLNELLLEQGQVMQENSFFAEAYAREIAAVVAAADKGNEIRSPAAVMMGSTAGYSAMVAAGNYAVGAAETQTQRLERVLQSMKEEQQRTTRAAEEINQALRQQKAPNVLQLPGA
jgi:hypothetical protein